MAGGNNKRTKAKPIVTPMPEGELRGEQIRGKSTRDDVTGQGNNDRSSANSDLPRKGMFNLGNRGKNKEVQRIGELPNKSKLQAKARDEPASLSDIVQLRGQAMAVSGGKSLPLTSGSNVKANSNLTSPGGRSFGASSFGTSWSFFGASNTSLKPELLDEDDDETISVSSDPGRSGLKGIKRSNKKGQNVNAKDTARSAESGSMGLEGLPAKVSQLAGDLQWIPIVQQTPLANTFVDGDTSSVSSDQSEIRGSRRSRQRRRSQREYKRRELTKEELAAAEMAAQVAALHQKKVSVEESIKTIQSDKEEGEELRSTKEVLEEKSEEWHEAMGPAERIHEQRLKERDHIDSEPIRRKRDKRKKDESRGQTKMLSSLPVPEPALPEADMDLSHPSMPSLANFSLGEGQAMVVKAFSKQHAETTTTDVRSQIGYPDPSSTSNGTKAVERPAVHSTHSIDSSDMEGSSHIEDMELSEDKREIEPQWLPLEQHRNVYSQELNVDDEASSHGKIRDDKREEPRADVVNTFDTLNRSLHSCDSSLGGSSRMLGSTEDVPYTDLSSSVLRGGRPDAANLDTDDNASEPRTLRRKPTVDKPDSTDPTDLLDFTMEVETTHSNDGSVAKGWKVDESPTEIHASVTLTAYASADSTEIDYTSSPSLKAATNKQGRKEMQVDPVEDHMDAAPGTAEELSETELTTEKEWHTTPIRLFQDNDGKNRENERRPRRSRSPKSKKSKSVKRPQQNEKVAEEVSVSIENEQRWHRVPVRPRNVEAARNEGGSSQAGEIISKTTKAKNKREPKTSQRPGEGSQKATSKSNRPRRRDRKSSSQPSGSRNFSSFEDVREAAESEVAEEMLSVGLVDGPHLSSAIQLAPAIRDQGKYNQEMHPLTLPVPSFNQAPLCEQGEAPGDEIGQTGTITIGHPFSELEIQGRPIEDRDKNGDIPGEAGLSEEVSTQTETTTMIAAFEVRQICTTHAVEGDDEYVENSEWFAINVKPDNHDTVDQETVCLDKKNPPAETTELQQQELTTGSSIPLHNDRQEASPAVDIPLKVTEHETVPFVPTISVLASQPTQSYGEQIPDVRDETGKRDQTKYKQHPRDTSSSNLMHAKTNFETQINNDFTSNFAGAHEDNDSDDSSFVSTNALGLENIDKEVGNHCPADGEAGPVEDGAFFSCEVEHDAKPARVFGKSSDGQFKSPPQTNTDLAPSNVSREVDLVGSVNHAHKPLSSLPDSPLDDLTVQSVDRALGKVSERSEQLRQQVHSRREALSGMLEASKNKSISVDNELLDLKRKLTISQGLVQELEVENDQIRRQSISDVSRVQTCLLERLHARETELSEQIKELMSQRNAAVEESHQLRMIITQSCDVCRKSFLEKDFFMDFSVRNTILERRAPRNSFAWITTNLAGEAQTTIDDPQATRNVDRLPLQNDRLMSIEKNRLCTSSETGSIAAALPDTGSVLSNPIPVFSGTPLHWLSERVFQKREFEAEKNEMEDKPVMDESVTCERVPKITPTVHNQSFEEAIDAGITEDGDAVEVYNDGTSMRASERQGKTKQRKPDGGLPRSLRGGKGKKKEGKRNELSDLNEESTSSVRENISGLVNEALHGQDATPDVKTVRDPWSNQVEELSDLDPKDGRANSGPTNPVRMPAGRRQKKNTTFFGSLIGEQVLDDFSSFVSHAAGPLNNGVESMKTKKPGKFSFFGSLTEEQVDDDMAFLDSERSLKAPLGGNKRAANFILAKSRDLLGQERVEDDMRSLNESLVRARVTRQSRSMNNFPVAKKRGFGLNDEKVEDEFLLDLRRLNPRERVTPLHGQDPDGTRREAQAATTLVGWSRERLGKEQVRNDTQALDTVHATNNPLTDEHVETFSGENTNTQTTDSPGSDAGNKIFSATSPVSSTGLPAKETGFVSPYSSKGILSLGRKRSGTNRGRRGSDWQQDVPRYLNRFRSSTTNELDPLEGDDKMADLHATTGDDEYNGKLSSFSDDHSPLSKRASAAGFGSLESDLIGSRPWRSDAGNVRKLSRRLPTQAESAAESLDEVESDGDSVGDYDPEKASKALLRDPLGALDALHVGKPPDIPVATGLDALAALDSVPGNKVLSGEATRLDEDPLRYLDALGGQNAFSPDDSVDGIAPLPL